MTISLTTSAPPRSTKAIVFAVDRNYAKFAFFTAQQIAQRHPERDFDICVISTDPLELPGGLANSGIRIGRLETGGLFSNFGFDARRTEAVYARLVLPEALRGDYSRILYLDADIFVQAGDFSALLDLDIGNNAVAAIRDNIQWRTPGRMPPAFRTLGLENAAYFNSGVMLIDVEAFNSQEILRRCVELGLEHTKVLAVFDQDLLNVVLHGHWAELGPVWNWQYTRSSILFEAMYSANIVHFIGSKKPWLQKSEHLPPRIRRAYRQFLNAEYPGEYSINPEYVTSNNQHRTWFRRSLFKHFTATGKFNRYLDRFPNELTVYVQ